MNYDWVLRNCSSVEDARIVYLIEYIVNCCDAIKL